MLKDKVALVTGAGRGIGRAIAEELSRAGAVVGWVVRDGKDLELSGRGFVVRCDLERDEEVMGVGEQVKRAVGRGVDILVHCAGVYYQGPFERSTVEALDHQYRVNLRAPYLLTLALIDQVRQVVFVNSTTGLNARPGVAGYAATKHGLRAVADCLRQELGPRGVRVISVYPGKVATDMQQRRHEIEGKAYEPQKLIQPADVAAVVVNALGLPPTAEVSDVQVRPVG
jgi:NAD(P)-dependent dehydrogenase (short-subunit alcohol dehydrogenase family)